MFCRRALLQAFPILKEIGRRSEQKEQLHDITVLMSSAAKVIPFRIPHTFVFALFFYTCFAFFFSIF